MLNLKSLEVLASYSELMSFVNYPPISIQHEELSEKHFLNILLEYEFNCFEPIEKVSLLLSMDRGASHITNPKPFLQQLIGQVVIVVLKWGVSYKGVLVSYDNYFNYQLQNAEEYISGQLQGFLGEILIRGNNVLYVQDPSTLPETDPPISSQPENLEEDPEESAEENSDA